MALRKIETDTVALENYLKVQRSIASSRLAAVAAKRAQRKPNTK